MCKLKAFYNFEWFGGNISTSLAVTPYLRTPVPKSQPQDLRSANALAKERDELRARQQQQPPERELRGGGVAGGGPRAAVRRRRVRARREQAQYAEDVARARSLHTKNVLISPCQDS